METFKFYQNWLDEFFPQGMVIPSSTLISGEGGSGKPLIGFSMLASWLEQGGNAVFILTSTGLDFARNTFKEVYGMNLDYYSSQLRFVMLDPDMDIKAPPTDFESWDTPSRVNLVNPDNWDKAIEKAETEFLSSQTAGTMVFGSALNLMLFSKTYGDSILEKFQRIIGEDKSRTFLFTVSTSALADKIKTLEDRADNLMFTRNEKPMKLFLKVTRMLDVDFTTKESPVPLSQGDLETIKRLAEGSRSNLIPKIMRI